MQPTLMVVGVNFRTAPASVREHFRMGGDCCGKALERLSGAEGVEEVVILATPDRTEFLLWASDVTLAANSVMRMLAAGCGLKLTEWEHFHHLLDEAALFHIFGVASGVDASPDEEQIALELEKAWRQSQNVRAIGPFLDSVMQRAFTAAKRVHGETAFDSAAKPQGVARDVILASVQSILREEVEGLRGKLTAGEVLPTIAALRAKLDEICQQELETYRQENGPFPKEQDALLSAVMMRVNQRIAGSLVRELRELPDKSQQEELTAAVQHLFHLQTLKARGIS